MNKKLIVAILCVIINAITLFSQAQFTDTLYQTSSRFAVYPTEDYIYYTSSVNGQFTLNRLKDGNIESSTIPYKYSDCIGATIFTYKDFIYIEFLPFFGCSADNDFLWGQDSLIVDTLNINGIYFNHGYKNYLIEDAGFLLNSNLYNVLTEERQIIDFENSPFKYTNQGGYTLNDSIINMDVFKRDIATNTILGDAIVQYNWKKDELSELYFSSQGLSLQSKFLEEKKVVFTESHPTGDFDSTRLFYYDGVELKLIAQKNITNSFAQPYLNGVVYQAGIELLYWQNGITVKLSDDAPDGFKVNNCQLAWNSRVNSDRSINFFDGSNFTSLPYSGTTGSFFDYIHLTDTSFLFLNQNDDLNKNYLVEGTTGLNCYNNCDLPNISVSSNDTNSYLRTGSVTSNAEIIGTNVIYNAKDFIRLTPGFQTTDNGTFLAKIRNCENNSNILDKEEKAESRKSYSEGVNNIIDIEEKKSWIEQNNPNPFSETTLVKYSISKYQKSAELRIYNYVGQQVQQIRLNQVGTGITHLNMSDFSKGLYQLVLIIDGKIVDSKKMVLIK